MDLFRDIVVTDDTTEFLVRSPSIDIPATPSSAPSPPCHGGGSAQDQAMFMSHPAVPARPRQDLIPRPAARDKAWWPGKMLADPPHSIRAADLNDRRQPGCVRMNPITLSGTTVLLPGEWGQGKEFETTMPWCRSTERPTHKERAAGGGMGGGDVRLDHAHQVARVREVEDRSRVGSEVHSMLGAVVVATGPLIRFDLHANDDEWSDVSDDNGDHEDGPRDTPVRNTSQGQNMDRSTRGMLAVRPRMQATRVTGRFVRPDE